MRFRPANLALCFAMLMFSACASIGPPQPPSLDLPKPPTDLRASRKADRVTLTWTVPLATTDRQTIRALGPTRICRAVNSNLAACDNPVGEAPAQKRSPTKASESAHQSYTDTLSSEMEADSPSAFVAYAVEVLNPAGRAARLSNQVEVPLVRTLAPPKDFQARLTAQGVVLTWSLEAPPPAPGDSIRYAVRIYRQQAASPQANIIAELPPEGDHVFTDSNIEWEKTYEYHANVVTIIDERKGAVQIEGDDTPDLKVFADDVFPPTVPAGLQAVFSGPGQSPFIDLIWAPDTDADLAGYNVYRREANGSPIKLNSDPVKNTAYRDTTVEPGKTYMYSVTAVDLRGNESARSEEATEGVPP